LWRRRKWRHDDDISEFDNHLEHNDHARYDNDR
jgi:hypothetical protein